MHQRPQGHDHPQRPFRGQPARERDYVGQAPVTLSLNRHKPIHVAADKPGCLSTEKTFYPEMTTQGAILWGSNNEKSKDFKTDTLTIRLKKAESGAPPLRELPAQW